MPDHKRFSKLGGAAATAMAALLLLGLSACSITADKSEGEKKKNVDIQTPFGGLKVRTEVDPKEIGLPVYAGARQVPEDDHHDSPSGNVTLGLPGFGLKVIAASFETDDSPDKVLEFYRKELKTYGDVTECKGNIDLKGDDPNSQEITCKEGIGVERNKTSLAVGRGPSHRIISVEPRARGCKFALVYLQMHSGKESTM